MKKMSENPIAKRVLVCGGRDYSDYKAISGWLDHFRLHTPILVIIHGGAAGADSLAGRWAYERGITVLKFDADWEKYGRAAGPIRNKQMLDEGLPDLVVAFPGGRGTDDWLSRARREAFWSHALDRPKRTPHRCPIF